MSVAFLADLCCGRRRHSPKRDGRGRKRARQELHEDEASPGNDERAMAMASQVEAGPESNANEAHASLVASLTWPLSIFLTRRGAHAALNPKT